MMRSELTVEIIGAGVVGQATGKALSHWGHTPVFKDIDQDTLDNLSEEGYNTANDGEYVDADLSMICVPTPYDNDAGEYDMSYVYTAVESLSKHTDLTDRVVTIHSTALPGTTEDLIEKYNINHAAMVPELLKQRQAITDALELDTVVIGASSEKAYEVCASAYSTKETIIKCEPTEAEVIKFASNNYASTKISFANELWRISRNLDVNPTVVEYGFQQVSPWVENSGSGEDGLSGGWPYAGACLPKDSKGSLSYLSGLGIDVPQLKGTIEENNLMKQLAENNKTKEPTVPTE
jgi:UDPglucose 6-dehydrogenase